MIDALIQGKLYGQPAQRLTKANKPFAVAKLRVATTEGESTFVSVVAFDDVPVAVLQGAEAAILRSVINVHGASLLLLPHDGWVTAKRPSKAAMQAEIEAATGYRIELEISQL